MKAHLIISDINNHDINIEILFLCSNLKLSTIFQILPRSKLLILREHWNKVDKSKLKQIKNSLLQCILFTNWKTFQNLNNAKKIYLIYLFIKISENYGIPGLKAALDSYGFFGGACRLPLLDLNEDEIHNLKTIFEQSGFSWPEFNKPADIILQTNTVNFESSKS